MIKKCSISLAIILIGIISTNCSIKTDLTDKDFEEKFNFKGITKLYNLDDKKNILKTFSVYDFNYNDSKKKSLNECQNYLLILQDKQKYKCKVNVQITNKIKTSLN